MTIVPAHITASSGVRALLTTTAVLLLTALSDASLLCVAAALPPHHHALHSRLAIMKNGPPLRHHADASSSSSPSYGTANCTEHFFTQTLDHFHFGPAPATFPQRFYVCMQAEWWNPNGDGPIFFYTGNECDVDLYVNMTGLMWENAAAMGAVLVFAEHRFFGKSLPFPGQTMPPPQDLATLTTDQALMDYATIIEYLRNDFFHSPTSAVIGFGGSYGGMLCAWLRSKYPSALDGCIAGSAPIIPFEGVQPPVPTDGFAVVETADASTAGGVSDLCMENINTAFMTIYNAKNDVPTMTTIAEALGVCGPASTAAAASLQADILNAFNNAIGMMTMGSYPFPSGYMMLGGKGMLPPYPMRKACTATPLGTTKSFASTAALLAAFGEAMQVFFSAAGPIPCINVSGAVNEASAVTGYLWGYLACTELYMPTSTTGNLSAFMHNGQQQGGDMFYPSPYSSADAIAGCQAAYGGTTPVLDYVAVAFGGRRVPETASNIFFSNGELDPWRYGGITPDAPNAAAFNPTVEAMIVRNAGHHMDLMFTSPQDGETNVADVRAAEVAAIRRWIAAKQQQQQQQHN